MASIEPLSLLHCYSLIKQLEIVINLYQLYNYILLILKPAIV